MKHKLFASFFILAAVACGQKNELAPVEPRPADYVGTVSVDFEGSTFDNEDIAVSFTPDEAGDFAEILIHKIKFVPRMPMTVDVTIPSIALKVDCQTIRMSVDDVDPIFMNGNYSRYRVAGFTGTLVDRKLSFSLNFGDYPTRFSGTIR